eukprot:3652637-Pyramimonas_sp.AAC.2
MFDREGLGRGNRRETEHRPLISRKHRVGGYPRPQPLEAIVFTVGRNDLRGQNSIRIERMLLLKREVLGRGRYRREHPLKLRGQSRPDLVISDPL